MGHGVNGPICDWSPDIDVDGAALQHGCEASEAALQKTTAESGLDRKHGQRALCLALMAVAVPQMSAQPGTGPDAT